MSHRATCCCLLSLFAAFCVPVARAAALDSAQAPDLEAPLLGDGPVECSERLGGLLKFGRRAS